jgi:hypothetical protein
MKYSAPLAIAPHTPSGAATVAASVKRFINPPKDRSTGHFDHACQESIGGSSKSVVTL